LAKLKPLGPKASTLVTRVISAVIALIILFTIIYFFKDNGLRVVCLFVVVLGTRELIRILFKPEDPFRIKAFFYVSTVLLFISSVTTAELSAAIFASISVIYFSASLFMHRRFEDLSSFSFFAAKSILGFVYIGLLPAFACKLLDLKFGFAWFSTLLCVVFAGDTFAYLSGLLWGNKKLMPAISPKKTVVGSLGGLVGSVVAAISCSLFLPEMPTFLVITLGSLTGAVGQSGDLFESMLKRVADKKDSGRLLPGHGGVLDRLDGVLFAAPVFYLGAVLIERFFT
jgi:phosphatidate cytidylyltransferase